MKGDFPRSLIGVGGSTSCVPLRQVLLTSCKARLNVGIGVGHTFSVAKTYWGQGVRRDLQPTVLRGGQRANDSFLLLLVPLLKPQVLFYSGKFISCGFVVKKKMTLSLNGPLVGPWADRPPTVVCLAKKPPGTVTSFPKK